MKKVTMSIMLMLFLSTPSWAGLAESSMASGYIAASITDANANHGRCRGVWIGTTQSVDFSFDGANWTTFQGATAGTIVPVQVVGARITSGSAAPAAGDIVFLY